MGLCRDKPADELAEFIFPGIVLADHQPDTPGVADHHRRDLDQLQAQVVDAHALEAGVLQVKAQALEQCVGKA